jgi:hypothetical protein
MRRLLTLLECLECEARCGEFERGWRAYRLPEPGEPILVLCPDCAEREFGEDEHMQDS